MKKTLNYIFILDRSGSMSSLREQTLANVNNQIHDLKQDAKKTKVNINLSILLFDTRGNGPQDWFSYVVRNKKIENVIPLTIEEYVPSGGTPLRDAIGHGVENIQKDLGDKINSNNQKILVTIFTDGEENSSQKYSHEKCQQMIKHLQEDGKFVFTFVGAGGIAEVASYSTSLGIAASNTMAYSNDAVGNKRAFANLTKARTAYVSSYSKGEEKSVDFFSEPS